MTMQTWYPAYNIYIYDMIYDMYTYIYIFAYLDIYIYLQMSFFLNAALVSVLFFACVQKVQRKCLTSPEPTCLLLVCLENASCFPR